MSLKLAEELQLRMIPLTQYLEVTGGQARCKHPMLGLRKTKEQIHVSEDYGSVGKGVRLLTIRGKTLHLPVDFSKTAEDESNGSIF